MWSSPPWSARTLNLSAERSLDFCSHLPKSTQLVRIGIAMDAVEGFVKVGGSGSVAVMTRFSAQIRRPRSENPQVTGTRSPEAPTRRSDLTGHADISRK